MSDGRSASLHPSSTNAETGGWIALAPVTFVVLWSSGFIGAKYGLPYAGPLTFLTIRFAAVLVILLPIALLLRAAWPSRGRDYAHIAVAGLLLHAGYLSGVFGALHHGMSAGVIALIVGLQPVLTAVLATAWLKERISTRQVLGLILGLVGVALVVWEKLDLSADATAFQLALLALCAITVGTLYQKRHCPHLNLLSGATIQYAACLGCMLVLAPLLEDMRVAWTPQFLFALGWLVFVLSIASIMLLYVLIRRGAATRVTALFYLVPPTTALMAWLLFGERFSVWAMLGMAVCALGVALVVRQPRPA